MDYDKYERMFHRLRRQSERFPSLYRLKLFIIVALGYGVFFSFLVISLGILVFSLFIFSVDHLNIGLALLNGVLLFLAILHLISLWVKGNPLPFPILPRELAPKLYKEVENISTELKGPAIHHIHFSDEESVYIAPVPKWGLFMSPQIHLVVGIPMMMGLSQEEFRALLVKEIGFYSKKEDRFLSWIYKLNKTWGALSPSLSQRNGFPRSYLVRKFFSWFIPYLSAHAVVLSIKQEYKADHVAARVLGTQTVSRMLVRLELNNLSLQRNYWEEVYSLAKSQSVPPQGVYSQMEDFLLQPFNGKEAASWLNELLEMKTREVNVEPSLSDRLHHLGEKGVLPEPLNGTAFRYYLSSPEKVCFVLNHHWRDQIKENWLDTYNHTRDRKEELEQLNEKSRRGQLNQEEKMERAFLTGELYGEAQSYPLFEENARKEIDDPVAQFYFGKILLTRNNPEGVAYLLRAIALDEEARMNGYPMIYRFYLERGEEKEGEKYKEKVSEANQVLEARRRAKTTLFPQDRFLPHDLPESFILEIKDHLKHYYPVLQAYLVRKDLDFPSLEPVFFLGLTVLRPFYLLTPSLREKYERKLAKKIINELNFPKWLTIVVFNYETRTIRKKMQNIKGSRLL